MLHIARRAGGRGQGGRRDNIFKILAKLQKFMEVKSKPIWTAEKSFSFSPEICFSFIASLKILSY